MIVCFVDVSVFLVFMGATILDDCLFCRCRGHLCSFVQGVLLG